MSSAPLSSTTPPVAELVPSNRGDSPLPDGSGQGPGAVKTNCVSPNQIRLLAFSLKRTGRHSGEGGKRKLHAVNLASDVVSGFPPSR